MKNLKVYDALEVEAMSNHGYEVYILMYNLEDWFGLIIKLHSLLQWENFRHSLLCISLISLFFLLIYILNPPFLFALGVMGLVFSFIDYFGPSLSLK